MDTSSELVHALLPLYMVGVLGASVFVVGIVEGVAEAIALMVRVFSGYWSDAFSRRKPLVVLGYAMGAAVGALATGVALRRAFAIGLAGVTVIALLRAAVLLAATAAACAFLPFGLARVLVSAVLGLAWLGLSVRDDAGRAALLRVRERFFPLAANAGGK